MNIQWTNDTSMFDHALCEETTGAIGDDYIRCGRPAEAVVLSERGKRLYFMCALDAIHTVRNRGGLLIAQKVKINIDTAREQYRWHVHGCRACQVAQDATAPYFGVNLAVDGCPEGKALLGVVIYAASLTRMK